MKVRDWTIIRDNRVRGVICDLMSQMLGCPDEHGIYPTSRFMGQMEDFVLAEILAAEARGLELGREAYDSIAGYATHGYHCATGGGPTCPCDCGYEVAQRRAATILTAAKLKEART